MLKSKTNVRYLLESLRSILDGSKNMLNVVFDGPRDVLDGLRLMLDMSKTMLDNPYIRRIGPTKLCAPSPHQRGVLATVGYIWFNHKL